MKKQREYESYPTLIIVESPSKCKTIEEYLGKEYKCIASFGHLTEITKLDDVNAPNFMGCKYSIIKTKEKTVNYIGKEIEKAFDVIIATDDDREGEAIGWHICQLFDLPINSTKRIIFHEITKSAICHAIENPTLINMDIVHSQQTRQIIDIMVGHSISPLLWKFLPNNKGLSAGRCQTPAIHIIQENQKKIDETYKKEYIYETTGYFKSNINYECNTIFKTRKELLEFLNISLEYKYILTNTPPKYILKQPPTPLTTSHMQQLGSNLFNLSPKETMNVCQTLYENGLITYMRTDSTVYSKEFLLSVNNYVNKYYGNDYYNNLLEPTDDSTKAHEAIRPTNINIKSISTDFSLRERQIYKTIWKQSLESCMTESKYLFFSSKITPEKCKIYGDLYYSRSCEYPVFLGWEIIKKDEGSIISLQQEKIYNIVFSYNNLHVHFTNIKSKVSTTTNKLHYTESKLINKLEKLGIGRPSTFASIVEKIKTKEYVIKNDIIGEEIECFDYEINNTDNNDNKYVIIEQINKRSFSGEKNKLILQPLGHIVVDFLMKHFNCLFNYEYTREMEIKLDKISTGELNYKIICLECYYLLQSTIEKIKIESFKIKLDDQHTFIMGKNGPVVKYQETPNSIVQLKSVKNDILIDNLTNVKTRNNSSEITNIIQTDDESNKKNLGKYKNQDIILRRGKFGLYVNYMGTMKSLSKHFGNRPISNISLEEVIEILENSLECNNIIRIINQNAKILKGKEGKGDYIFFKSKQMKKPRFITLCNFNDNYNSCNVNKITEYISLMFNNAKK
jgi:DNA topoisomerase-1